MKYEKGDLIAVKTLENNRVTCIIVSTFNEGQFSYCYTVETGMYRLVYVQEIEFIIVKDFDTNLDIFSDDLDMDYSFYEACSHAYSYTPYFGFPYHSEDDDDGVK